MNVLSDYLVSVVIGGFLLLIVIGLAFRGSQETIDATQYRAAKVGTLSLVEAIERDFNNIGSLYLPNDHVELDPAYAILAYDTTGSPAFFTFRAQTDSLQAGFSTVRYEWDLSGKTVQLKNGPKLINDVRRIVDGNVDGRWTGMVTAFQVHLLACDSTTNYVNINGPDSKVRQILVRFKAVSPLGPGDSIEEVRWEKMFRPPNIWKAWKQEDGC